MKKIILSIDGMTCSACSNGLEKYLNKQNGIINASVNLVMSNASIDYDEKILNQEKLEKFVKQAGFSSSGIFKGFKEEKASKQEKIKFAIYTILAILLMYISMGHMIGLPIPSFIQPEMNPLMYMVSQLIIVILFFIYGFDILKNGWKNLIHKSPNMDTLVSLGVVSSFVYSLYGMSMTIFTNENHIMNLYFESSAIVIYFIKLGRYIDKMSKNKTRDAVQKLVEITPQTATLEVDEEEKIVTLDEIKKGNTLIAKPGEKIAVDGEIIEGKTHIDESFITGESKPALKNIGDKVVAGSINYDGYIKYKAEKIGKESTVSEIVRLVIEASNTKAPIARIADKISGFFVPVVMILAFITFLVYLLLGNELSVALTTFVTILVVACPCSLGLATPLAIVVSEGICASRGILVKKSEILEIASKVDTIIFDKTGTLTYGNLKISEIKNYTSQSNDDIIKLMASIEKNSTHPISKAFGEYTSIHNLKLDEVIEFEEISGLGIRGKINNQIYYLGNRKLLEKYHIVNHYLKDEEELTKSGNSIVYLATDNNVLVIVGVNDIVRENADLFIQTLKKQNIHTIMLTGDNKNTADKVGNELKIDEIISDVLPSEKANIVKKLKSDGKIVMMCGDGINDSPALANADIGISIKSGTDIAMDSSDVILMNNELESINKVIDISKKTIKNIKQNLFWAFIYNILMIPIAMGLFSKYISITPMIASIAMTLSSLIVVCNALSLKIICKK